MVEGFTGRKLFLIAANEKVVREIHFQSRGVVDGAVVFTLTPEHLLQDLRGGNESNEKS